MNGNSINEKNNNNRKRKSNTSEKCSKNIPKKKSRSNEKFEFGNYNRYYGYRNVDECTDTRIETFQTRKELFENKEILDIGCNIGHITYIIARDFAPKSILGIDIDNSLIQIARKNRPHYLNEKKTPLSKDNTLECDSQLQDVNRFDQSDSKQCENSSSSVDKNIKTLLKFPNNITFIHGNYVLSHDDLLAMEEPRYDLILCLSVTKWIHLNWGDDGLKRVFKRVYAQLRSGGVFILEAQPWESYKKKKLSAKLRRNCRDIKFYPKMFHEYLLNHVGFSSSEILTVPSHSSKGFQRPIILYYK